MPLLPRLLPVLVLALAALLVPIGPAAAHVGLVASNPADGATLKASPEVVVLTYSEGVRPVPSGIRVFDAEGREVESSVSVRDTALHVDVPDQLDEGTYVVVWRVVSVDAHPSAGSVTFSVGAPSARVEAPDIPDADRAWLTATLSVIDALVYLGLLLGVGLTIFGLLISRASRTRVLRVVRLVAPFGALAAAVRVPLVTVDQLGVGLGALTGRDAWAGVPGDVLASSAAAVVGLALLSWGRTTPSVLGCLVSLAAPTLTGHTRALDPVGLVALVDAWHLLAAAVWVGGLVGLALTWRHLRTDAWVAALSRFSGLGAGVLLVLAPTGVLMGWRIAETSEALTSTAYGAVLLTKVGVVVAVVAVAAWNRWVLLPRAHHTRLVRMVVAEASLLLLVVGLAGALVNQSPRPAPPDPGPVASVTAAAQLTDGLEVSVRLSPASVGTNDVRLTVRDGSGNTVEVSSPPSLVLVGPTGEEVVAELEAASDGSFSADVELVRAGEWRAEVRQRLDEFSEPRTHVLLVVE